MQYILLSDLTANLDLDRILAHAVDHLSIPSEVVIGVRFNPTMADECCGFCDEDDPEEGMIVVEINPNISDNEIILTIFHEMAHVSQLIDGRRTQIPSTWNGEHWNDETDYDTLPWEIDARSNEYQMARSYQQRSTIPYV